MSRTVLHGDVVLPDRVLEGGMVVLQDGRISYVGPAEGKSSGEGDLPSDVLLLPGLVDIHCHGAASGEFGADESASRRAAEHHHRSGTTSVVASLMSASPERLVEGMRTCAALAKEGLLAGVHTEGPFLSARRCGAQDPSILQAPDPALVQALADAAGGHWRVMTMAPELPGSGELLERLVELGVCPAFGHTDGTVQVIADAIARAGRLRGRPPLITHLFNGMAAFHHREPGAIGAALAALATGDVVVELVGDGVHLADEVTAMVMRLGKPGCVALVTDSMAACGMPEGRYTLGGLEVTVEADAARLTSNGALAGGLTTMLDLVRRCVSAGGIDLVTSVAAASWAPAQVAGLGAVSGNLSVGRDADVLVTTRGLDLLAVWRKEQRLASPESW